MSNALTSYKKNKIKKRNYFIENDSAIYNMVNKVSDIIKTAPLSFSQQQMWIIEQMQRGNYAYNLPVAFRLKGPLDFKVLERSFNKIISRHEILRTTFSEIDNLPRQLIHNELRLNIKRIPLNLTLENGEKNLSEIIKKEVTEPFDISRLPLLRVILIGLSQEESILLLNMHHIIADGWSMKILFQELSEYYNNSLNNKNSELSKPANQYSDYVYWQKKAEWSPSYEEQLKYWKNQLQGDLPTLNLPFDKQRPVMQSPSGANELFFLSKNLTDTLNSIGVKKGCSFFMTILAAFQVFLSKYSEMDDIIIGCPTSNRPDFAQNLVGNFLNVIALRINVSEYPDFPALLQNTRKISLDALKNWDLPFEKLVEVLKIKRDMSKNPVFQVMLQLLPEFSFDLKDIEINNFIFDTGYSQLDLSLHLYQVEDGYNCRIEYDTDLFNKDTIRRMTDNFKYFLEQLSVNPDQKISEISVIKTEEKNRLLYEWNNTNRNLPEDLNVIELFELQVQKSPDAEAVIFKNKKLTYRELNRRANLFAGYLKTRGVKQETIIGVCLDRSLDMIIGIMGILKAGAAYLPIDPSLPSERIKFICRDADLKFILTSKNYKKIFEHEDLLFLDSEPDKILHTGIPDKCSSINQKNLAYVIYTSGSTGNPKGVMIEHKSLTNFLISMKEQLEINERDILLAVTTISFDIAGLEIFLPLISGAIIYLADKMEAADGYALKNIIENMSITMMQATPSTWKLLIEAGWKKSPGLKMLCGGEAFSREFANALLKRGSILWNMYGPTETTIWSAVNKIEYENSPILIGRPINNTRFYIVDKFDQPVPVGVPGELLIGGYGVARGYLNRNKLTLEKFIPDKLNNNEEVLYRTGDLVKYNHAGKIYFLGRLDFQVKIRGFRIETGEIESVLNAHKAVNQAIVVASENSNSGKILSAYIIPEKDKYFSLSEIKDHLRKKLPDYMIPSKFIKMEKFPLNNSGKIDRKKLPVPDENYDLYEKQYVPPRDELDAQLKDIWEKSFGIKNIGINDDFFELGGHSLLAARIFTQIRKTLNKNLPLAALFRASTISKLSDQIKQENWIQSWDSLIPIKLSGTRPPLFLIHGAEGNILLYKALVKHLNEDQPVYGLQSPGLDGKSPILDDVKEMAQKYISEIKSIQPEGPYYLGGYCLGGTIAYEMARQLNQSGDEVGLVALIETCNIHNNNRRDITFLLKMLHKIENIIFQVRNIYKSRRKSRLHYFSEKLDVELNRFKVKLDILYSKLSSVIKSDSESEYRHLLMNKINDAAQNLYFPDEYNGKVLLFKPIRYFTGFNDNTLGWKNLITGELKVIEMTCYPRGSLNEPFVRILAEKLEGQLNKSTAKDYETVS